MAEDEATLGDRRAGSTLGEWRASWLTLWCRLSCSESRSLGDAQSLDVSIESVADRSGAAFCRRLPENRRRLSLSNAGASPEDGAAVDMSDMALTEGRVGYMLLIDDRDDGETPCDAPGECCEPYERTLEAGVKAGVSTVVDPMAEA